MLHSVLSPLSFLYTAICTGSQYRLFKVNEHVCSLDAIAMAWFLPFLCCFFSPVQVGEAFGARPQLQVLLMLTAVSDSP